MNDLITLAVAYGALIALVGGYTWLLLGRIADLHRRLAATEAVLGTDRGDESE